MHSAKNTGRTPGKEMISRANILEREKEFPATSLSVVRWVVELKVEKARLREDGSDRDKFNGVNGDQVR